MQTEHMIPVYLLILVLRFLHLSCSTSFLSIYSFIYYPSKDQVNSRVKGQHQREKMMKVPASPYSYEEAGNFIIFSRPTCPFTRYTDLIHLKGHSWSLDSWRSGNKRNKNGVSFFRPPFFFFFFGLSFWASFVRTKNENPQGFSPITVET